MSPTTFDDYPAFLLDGRWFFLEGDMYGPYSTQQIAEERRDAVKAFTQHAPACHHKY